MTIDKTIAILLITIMTALLLVGCQETKHMLPDDEDIEDFDTALK